MSSDHRYDLCLFGATGFTSRFVIDEIVSQLPSIRRRIPDFSWALAGRNEGSLKKLVEKVEQKVADSAVVPGIIVADVTDQATLEQMCEQSKIVLSAVGPYAHLGENLIKAILQASEKLVAKGQQGCDYADLCGEPSFVEDMVHRYGAKASSLGITILHSAGFDSIPADMGVVHAKQIVQTLQGASPTSIEMFFRIGASRENGFGIHYATYAAAVNGFATRKKLSKIRAQLYMSLDRTIPPVSIRLKGSSGLSSHQVSMLGLNLPILFAPDAPGGGEGASGGAWLLPFFFADPAVVRLSQALDQTLSQRSKPPRSTDTPPVRFVAWIVVPSFALLVFATVALTIFGLLASMKVGRSLLLAYPRIFSAGLVSHDGPTEAQLSSSSFSSTFVTRGHSQAALEALENGSQKGLQPDVKVVTRVTGPEVGYIATPICFVAAARVMLSQRERVRKGVLTPAAALFETSIVEDLSSDGRVKFTRVA